MKRVIIDILFANFAFGIVPASALAVLFHYGIPTRIEAAGLSLIFQWVGVLLVIGGIPLGLAFFVGRKNRKRFRITFALTWLAIIGFNFVV